MKKEKEKKINNNPNDKWLKVFGISIILVIVSFLGVTNWSNITETVGGWFSNIGSSNEDNTKVTEVKNVTITDTGLADAVEKVYDAVVIVKTYVKKQLYSTGSGFIYKKDGNKAYILTNNHVITSGDYITVVLSTDEEVEVKVKGTDSYSDLAVLEIDASKIKSVASIGKSENARVGDTVFAIGAPVNAETYAWTVTRGVLSGKDRLVGMSTSNQNSLFTTSDVMISVLQTDAAINSGNSGGPLCNANGEVIGITSMKLVTTGIESMGFAIPIDTAIKYAESLEKGKQIERPSIGIQMLSLVQAVYLYGVNINTKDVTEGVYIAKVNSNSAAEKAGIKAGDIITEIDGNKVKSIAYLRYYLYNHSVGDTIKVKVYRNGSFEELSLTLKETSNN